MSIIGDKYKNKYKDNKDWLSTLLDANATDAVTKVVTTKVEGEADKTETVDTGKRLVNLEKLFALAKANGIDTAKYEEQADRKNAPGRLRMTIGNMLRAAARKRHGLYIVGQNGTEWVEADAAFVGDTTATHDRAGFKIKPVAVEAETKPEAETTEA